MLGGAVATGALWGGDGVVADVVHCLCAGVCSGLALPGQCVAGIVVPLSGRGGQSLVAGCRGSSLLSVVA